MKRQQKPPSTDQVVSADKKDCVATCITKNSILRSREGYTFTFEEIVLCLSKVTFNPREGYLQRVCV